MSSPENLIFDSFPHSQGDPDLQKGIFRYLEQHDILSVEECLELLESGFDHFHSYSTGRAHTDPNIRNP